MKRNRAFTVVEVLVVIAILALLARILIPALASRRQGQNSTTEKKSSKRTIWVDSYEVRVFIVEIDGHDYLIVQDPGTGVDVVHSESCVCKKSAERLP